LDACDAGTGLRHGRQPRLLELWTRISKRNAFHANDPNSIYFSESDLQRYRKRFVAPQPDEPHLLYDGNPAAVIAALEASARDR
jgi:hypothetical protein